MQITYELDECIGDGVFNLTFHDASSRPPSMTAIEGTWATPEVAITVDADGTFTGATDIGCQLSGSIEPGTDAVNIYCLSMLMENCASLDGQYAGLASVFAENPGQDILVIGAMKTGGILWLGLPR